MSSSTLTKTLRILGLAAALMGPVLAQGAIARTAWTVDGPIELLQAPRAATGDQVTQSPAVTLLQESGATGGDGQHS